MRTSFLHLAGTRLGFRDLDDPEVFSKVAGQFRFAIDFAIEQRASFVVFSGGLFSSGQAQPDAFQVALRGLNQLAAKNIAAVAVRSRTELPSDSRAMSWHNMLAQEGLLASLEIQLQRDSQLGLDRWDRREGRGSFLDIGRCRVFGLRDYGSMTAALLPAFAKAITAQDNREADFRLVLLPGTLEHQTLSFVPRLSYGDVLLLKRTVDYVALGGCDEQYETEDWVYNSGADGFYHVMVDTAVQPKHQARYVTYPAALAVQRPAPPQRRESRAEQEEAILDRLVGAKQDGAPSDDPSRDVVRLVTRSMWGDRNSAGLRARLLEVVGQMREPRDAA